MGAQPLACLLGLSLPRIEPDWLSGFSAGFYALADDCGCPLIGGDTTRTGAGIVISVTVFGQVDASAALRRSAARVGDDIWVTGTLGAADIALQLLLGKLPADAALLAATRPALERPLPPLAFAQDLPGLAHAGMDISDGLIQDFGHILAASSVGAELDYELLPLDPALYNLPACVQQRACLGGGDVYQLCFTASDHNRDRILDLGLLHGVRASRVGRITRRPGLRVRMASGDFLTPLPAGFDHFDPGRTD